MNLLCVLSFAGLFVDFFKKLVWSMTSLIFIFPDLAAENIEKDIGQQGQD